MGQLSIRLSSQILQDMGTRFPAFRGIVEVSGMSALQFVS